MHARASLADLSRYHLGQLARNYSFLGDQAMTKLRKSYVVIVGCGGVGSWCALMLLRRYGACLLCYKGHAANA